MDRSWRIVVPLRLAEAKTRLSTQPAPRRRELVVAMALDVIAAARDCRVVDEVRLVADAAGLEAVSPGVSALPDPGGGLNAAILHGAAGAPGVCEVAARSSNQVINQSINTRPYG